MYIIWKINRDLHMIQLNSYRIERYIKWLVKNWGQYTAVRNFLPFFTFSLFAYLTPIQFIIIWGISYIPLVLFKIRYESKIALKYTSRAKRLLCTIISIYVIVALVGVYIFTLSTRPTTLLLVTICLTTLTFLSFIPSIFGCVAILPLEKAIEYWYYKDAQNKILKATNLTTIGITGSFGKTSTKFILNEILSSFFNTLMTPQSFNTKMGVTKVVRNDLSPVHNFFIAEMGAKQKGDIKEICDLVHPKIGVLTAIGEQHLESFKSLENICRTKLELIEALPNDGIAILNGDDANIRNLKISNNPRKLFFGIDSKKLDYFVRNINISPQGTSFEISTYRGESATFHTKLLGKHNIYNILAAVAVANELGINLQLLSIQVKKLRPAPHRLEIRKIADGITVLDNAFSSNPVGAKMALDVLNQMEGSRKILITPGMIELGNKEYDYNKNFGTYAANICDLIILVGQKQTIPIQDGLAVANYPASNLYVAADLNNASAHLRSVMKPGDVILYENDLPDNYL